MCVNQQSDLLGEDKKKILMKSRLSIQNDNKLSIVCKNHKTERTLFIMSDWDEDMYDESEEEVLSFEDEDESYGSGNVERSSPPLNSEALYFKAKNLKEEENYEEALCVFDDLIQNSESSEEYIFKSIKQKIKIYEHQRCFETICPMLKKLLLFKERVDSSYFSSSLLKILTRLERSNIGIEAKLSILQVFDNYISTLKMTQMDFSTRKLKYKVVLALANQKLVENDYTKAVQILSGLENDIELEDETIKNSFFLDIIAGKLLVLLGNSAPIKELKTYANKATLLISGIPQTRVLGIINEASGVVAMYSEDYKNANKYFQDAFRHYNDSGDTRRVNILVKFVISSILSKSEVNPFQSSDIQGFLKLGSIKLLMNMRNAIQENNVSKYNVIIESTDFSTSFLGQKFLSDFIPVITHMVYSQFVISQIALFERVSFDYFIEKMNIKLSEFKKLVLELFNVGLISKIKIDFRHGIIRKTDCTFLHEKSVNPVSYIRNCFAYYNLCDSATHMDLEREMDNLARNQNKEIGDIEITEKRALNGCSNSDFDVSSKRKFFETFTTKYNVKIQPTNTEDLEMSKFDLFYNNINLRVLAKELFKNHTVGLDLFDDTEIRNKLIKQIELYLRLLSSSAPLPITDDLSFVNRVKDDKRSSEFKKLFSNDKEINVFTQYDPNIPEVTQETSMNPLEPPENFDLIRDPDVSLSRNEKLLERLKTIAKTTEIITEKNAITLLNSGNVNGAADDYELSPRKQLDRGGSYTRLNPCEIFSSVDSPFKATEDQYDYNYAYEDNINNKNGKEDYNDNDDDNLSFNEY